MAGPWLLATSIAVHLLLVRADIEIGTTVTSNLLDRGGHLDNRQVSNGGSLTSSLTPVATICAASDGFGISSLQDGGFQTTSATVRLPGGGSTLFATRVKRQTGQSGIPTDFADGAHLVSGTDGCSTLFTPTTYSACSTVVSPIGLPPVTVTECDQYITFSSETLFMCPQTPTISPRPASSFPYRSAGSFTTRPSLLQNGTFMNASTTFTPSADSKDVKLGYSNIRSYSTASGMPMPIPARFQKRQIMLDHNGRPMKTEAAIIAPGMHLNPGQSMLDRGGGEATTDLTVVAPNTPSERDTMSTVMPMRNKMMASDMADTSNLMPPHRTASTNEPPVASKLIPIPDMLKPKYKRKYIATGNKACRNDESPTPIILDVSKSTINTALAPSSSNTKQDSLSETNKSAGLTTAAKRADDIIHREKNGEDVHFNKVVNMTTSTARNAALHHSDVRVAFHGSHDRARAKPLVNAVVPLSMNATRTNGTRLSSKLAKLDTIRIANAAYAARAAQAPNAQNASPPSPTKFYAAPWSEIVAGGVPQHILGITCYGGGDHIGKCTEPDSDGDPEECECVTERQRWSVTSITETRIGTTIVSYSGPLVITGPNGAVTTTNIRFLSTMSTTRSFVDSWVVKKTLTGEETVTQTMTSVPIATVSLLPVADAKAGMPQEAPAPLSDEATTVVLTSYVATETVTVLPPEETADMAGNGSEYDMVPGLEADGNVDVTNMRRDVRNCEKPGVEWDCDVWSRK